METKEEPSEDSVKFATYLKEEKGISDSSLETYFKYYNLLTKMISLNKDRSVPKLTSEQVKTFVIKRHNNFAVRGFTKAFLQYQEQDIQLPPRSTGRKKQRIIRNLTPLEIEKIKEFLYKKSYQSGLIFDIITQGALRLSEIMNIKINSFNWMEWKKNPETYSKLHIEGKGKKERNVLINPDTMQDILTHLEKRHSTMDFQFIANQKTFLFDDISPIKVYYLIKKASKEVIGIDIRPHELRHSRATNLLKSGNDIFDIKNLLGHSSVAITEIYLHKSEEDSLKNIEKNLKKEAENEKNIYN